MLLDIISKMTAQPQSCEQPIVINDDDVDHTALSGYPIDFLAVPAAASAGPCRPVFDSQLESSRCKGFRQRASSDGRPREAGP